MAQQIASRLGLTSVYDFRERDDMLLAQLSDSDSVNAASLYEMDPIG